MPHPLTDVHLSRRLERVEARASAAFVEARARLQPDVDAAWRDIAGAYAMFDGVGSPITQSFGLGLFHDASAGDFDAVEAFFQARGAEPMHEVSPLADPALLPLLVARGYRPVELTTILCADPADIAAPGARSREVAVRPIAPGEEARWADTAARGWGETPELADFMRGFGLVTAHARDAVPFIAEIGGEAAAAGMLAIHDGVALLAGASTVPAFRRRGAQAALLAARLAHARAAGCDLAMMGAAPGSTSQCNAERQGFRVAYTRIKWARQSAS